MTDSEYMSLREAAWRRPLTSDEKARLQSYLIIHAAAQHDWARNWLSISFCKISPTLRFHPTSQPEFFRRSKRMNFNPSIANRLDGWRGCGSGCHASQSRAWSLGWEGSVTKD